MTRRYSLSKMYIIFVSYLFVIVVISFVRFRGQDILFVPVPDHCLPFTFHCNYVVLDKIMNGRG